MADLVKYDSTLSSTPFGTIRLYCWTHAGVHEMPLADVERVVYALAAAIRDTLGASADDPELARELSTGLTLCPLEVRDAGNDPEMWGPHVDEGVAARRDARAAIFPARPAR